MCWFFMSFYLESCVWSDEILQSTWLRNSMKFCENLQKVRHSPWQAFGEESMSCTQKVQTHRNWKRQDWWRAKSRACLSFSFTSMGLFTNNLSWQAKQSIPNTTVMFYGNCMKMCEDFTPKFGDKRTGCYITTMWHLHLLSYQGIFLPKQLDYCPPPTLLFFVCPIEDETERWTQLPGCI
jgi:hypothetical protein